MHFKRFYISYGGHFETNYTIDKKGSFLDYSKDYYPIEILKPSHDQSELFVNALKYFKNTWQKSYGSNNYPEDFDDFLLALRNFCGRNDFAEEFTPDI